MKKYILFIILSMSSIGFADKFDTDDGPKNPIKKGLDDLKQINEKETKSFKDPVIANADLGIDAKDKLAPKIPGNPLEKNMEPKVKDSSFSEKTMPSEKSLHVISLDEEMKQDNKTLPKMPAGEESEEVVKEKQITPETTINETDLAVKEKKPKRGLFKLWEKIKDGAISLKDKIKSYFVKK